VPIYEYECKKCEHSFDLIHSYKDEEAKPCEVCGSRETFKVIHAPGVVFKGEGFYCNDEKKDRREATKKKFEKDKYLSPEARGDANSYKNKTTGYTSKVKSKNDKDKEKKKTTNKKT
jgi:putative FmdB family regulatory protein